MQLEKRKRREMENRISKYLRDRYFSINYSTWFRIFILTLLLVIFLEQRKIKLTSMEQEDDLDTVIAKLVDHAAQLNTQRFQCAIDMKV